MFRRSRLSIKPNVKPGGRGSSQTSNEDDKAHTSVQQPGPERKASNEKDASESPAVLSVPPAPLPNLGIEQEERDDPDEQQENVPLTKNEKSDKTGESGANSKLSVAPLQRRKRFSTMPNLAKPRSTSVSTQQSSNVTPKALPQQQSPLASVTNAVSIQGNQSPSQTSTTKKPLLKSLEKQKPSSGQHTKLPEKRTPIPQVPQFSPVKSSVHKDPAVGTNSTRPLMTRKTLSSPLKERVTPSCPPTKGTARSPSLSPARPKPAKIPSDLERLRKARKLREMLKEELRKEKKARRETIPIWENGNPPERTTMTMRDFIYYLPDTNPMLSSFEEEKRPSFPVLTKEPEVRTINAPANEDEDEESDDAVLGPRVKVAEDGTIIIDEESLTVEVLRKKGPNIVEENDPIFERGSQTTYSSFRKSTHTKPWSNKETDMFFLAISMVGTDFSMIGQLFPNRTRVEIKNKFKREEKLNSWRIDKAFKEKKPLDLEFFGELLTRVLEAETKKKKERNGRTKSQAPRKSSTTKRNRQRKKLAEIESDPDDPEPVEIADAELAEAGSNVVVAGTPASCSVEGQEDAQRKETISKPSPTKRKRKRKKNIAAEPAEQETAEEPPQEEIGSQEPKQKVRQCKKGIQKALASISGEDNNVGEQNAEDEDECHMVNGEISSNQGTSESQKPSQTKRKKKSNDKSLSDHESGAPSETTTPVTTENSKKSQHVYLQKSKPNLKVIRRKRAGGKGTDKTASEAIVSYDDENEDKSDKVKESPVQDHVAPNEEPTEVMNNEVSEKVVSSAPMPETVEADKTITEEILASKAQDSGTESRSMEKPEEPRAKPGQAVRSRFQKPKPNLGRAVAKKDVSTNERKIVPIQEKAIATKEVTELNPSIPITKASEVSEKTESDAYFAPKARTVDTIIHNNMPIHQDALQGPSGGASESIIPVSQSKVRFPEAVPVPSDSVELETQSITAADTEISKSDCRDSNEVQRSERTSECDSQDEHEELKLGAIQENIISKPTRSGRQPRPTAFYKSPAEQKPSAISTLVSEGENVGKGRSRPARSQKAKPKVGKSSKKEAQTKNVGKGQGASKITFVTLRASQEDDDDDEPELLEEDDIYPINPEEVNKAPAFVPISLRSPEPIQTQVEETMEELEIAVNVSDKNYDSEAEQSLPELPDESDPSQSCTLAAEEDYHTTTADQIELFVEVIEIASEDTGQEEDDCSTEPGDGLQDAAYTDVSCIDQKTMEQDSVLGSDPPCLQVVVCDAVPNVTDVHTESSRLDEQSVPTEKDLKDGMDLEESSLQKEDSHIASLSSSVNEQSDSSQTNRATRRCRFLKPKPNVSKITSRSHAKKPCPVTESREMKNSVEPSETTLQKEKHGNETEVNLNETLQLHLVTAEGDKQNITMDQVPAEQPNDKVSVPDERNNCVGNKEQMRKTEHLDNRTEHLHESLLIPEEQGRCMGYEEQLSRTEHLDDGTQHVDEKFSMPEEQGRCMGYEEQLSRTENLDDGTRNVDETLSIPQEQDKCMGYEEQLSRTEHPDDGTQYVDEKLSMPEEQDKCMGYEEQLSRTENLDDGTRNVDETLSIPQEQDKCMGYEEQLSRTENLDDGTRNVDETLSIPQEQDKCMGYEEQLSRTEHPDDGTQYVDEKLSMPEEQDKCMGYEEQLSRTENLDDGTRNVDETLSIPQEQDKCMGYEEQLSRTEHPDDGTQYVDEKLSIPQEQDKCMGYEEQLSRTENLDDGTQHVDETLSIPQEQDKCMGYEEQLSRTENLDDGTRNVDETLSIPQEQDKCMGYEEQLSRTENLDDGTQHVDETLSIPQEQDKCMGYEEQLSRTENLDDGTQHVDETLSIPQEQDKCMGYEEQLSRTEHLDDGTQHVDETLSIPQEQDKCMGYEEQLSRTENLDDGTQHVSDKLLFPEELGRCMGYEEQLSRTEHLDDGTRNVNEKLSIPQEQDKCMGYEEHLSRTENLDDGTQHVDETLSIPQEQDKCMGYEEQLSRTENLDDGTQHVDEKLSIRQEQDKCMGYEEQLSRTENLDDGTRNVNEKLSIPQEQDKCMGYEEQLSRTEHPDDGTQYVDEKLSMPEEQGRCMGFEEQLSRTENLDDGTQHVDETLSIPQEQDKCMGYEEQLSRTENLDDGTRNVGEKLSVLEDKYLGYEEQISRTKHLDDGTEHLSERVSPAHDQLQTSDQSQEAEVGFSSDAYFTQSTLSLCQTTDAGLSVQVPETTAAVSYFGYSQKVDIVEAQNAEHQESLNMSEQNLENMTIGSPSEETFILTLVEIPASSLTECDASSASFIPVSEDSLTVAEPVLISRLSVENIDVTESVSSEMEALNLPTVSESVPLTENTQQQPSLSKPNSNLGQMDRKRKSSLFEHNQDSSAKRNPMITSIGEESRGKVLLPEETTQSNLATCTSLEECPTTSTASILSNYDAAKMSLPSESTESFVDTPLDNVVDPVPVEKAAEACSVPEEMKKAASQIRRGKLTVKPNISTKRAMCISETSLPARNKNTLKLSRTSRSAPSPCVSEKSLQAESACNLSVDMNSAQWDSGSVYHNQGQTDVQETAAATESVYSTETLAADTDAGTTKQSEMSTQNAASTSITSLTRPGRKPRGFLSFISKKSSESESETKPQRTKFLKPRMNLPRFAGKRPIPSGEDAEEMKSSSSPPAKRKSCEEADGSQPDTRSAPTKVICNSSLQSWQSESYTEEACCAVEQDTEQMLPTQVAEYFFSDIFTEVDEQE
ncbi:transcription factor TFIIIB component B'' homolog isoform X2 [Heterodontus francisci]|uniref:transcription factor TFIIIB component B'' homolog isoform X2 n=1 Tax=Heterodontus francisci TaxID=7792 RepID=UPI00355BCD83